MPATTSKRVTGTRKASRKGATRKGKAAKVELTFKALKGLSVPVLLATRASTPRADLKGHYALRRALRANGHYVSQQ